MIDQVIVPLDGSESADRALGPAIEAAHRMGATLTLLRAVHPDDSDIAEAELGASMAAHEISGAETIVDTMNGPVGAITEALVDRPNSLVCMTTHGRGGITRVLLGSVAEEALREVEAPFLMVGPGYVDGTGLGSAVVAPIDGSHRSESVLPMAAEWARLLGSALWVVTVIDPADAERARAEGGELLESAYVQRVAQALPQGPAEVDWDVLHNADPAQAIVDFAEGLGGALVVMATHGRSGLARAAMGSVTGRVVHGHSGLTLVLRVSDLVEG